MMSQIQKTQPENAVEESLWKTWRANHMFPLWELPHGKPGEPERAQCWSWKDIRPILIDTARISSPATVERRVLNLVNRKSQDPLSDYATTGMMNAAFQTLLPGERARPHRHSMNALRFVIKGNGAESVVDGKACKMEAGDLVLTPAWCWHEHVHHGEGPVVWVDILDVTMHLHFGTDAFEPGPIHDLPQILPDKAFSTANIVPVAEFESRGHSPVFRYSREEAQAALLNAPRTPDGARRVRYVDPLTGGPCMSALDCYLIGLEGNQGPTVPFRSSASAICVVVSGSGRSVIGDEEIHWSPNDVFTLPQGHWARHEANEDATIFMATNREVYRLLGLLSEEYGS